MSRYAPQLLALCGGVLALGAYLAGRSGIARRRRIEPPRTVLRRALTHRRIEVHYQPVFDREGALAGAEALVRWRTPDGRLAGPAHLVDGVERGPEIEELTTYVISDALSLMRKMRTNHPMLSYVGVNVPASVMQQAAFADMVEARFGRQPDHAAGLVLELTETSAVEDWPAVRASIERLRAVGVRLALDDFGRAHANLPALADSNADVVKIDKSLLDSVLTNERSAEVVESVLRLADSLGMAVVAEGIEDHALLDWLRDHEVEYFQGFALGYPCSADDLRAGRYTNRPAPLVSNADRERTAGMAGLALCGVLLLGSASTVAIAADQWNRTAHADSTGVSIRNRLEHAYLEVVSATARRQTADAAVQIATVAPVGDDVVLAAFRRLDAAVVGAARSEPGDQFLMAAAGAVDAGRGLDAAGGLDAVADHARADILPSLERYFAGDPGMVSPALAAAALYTGFAQRVADVVIERHALGIDPNRPSGLTPTTSATDRDPIADAIDSIAAQGAWRQELGDIMAGDGYRSLADSWTAISAHDSSALTQIGIDQVVTDSLRLQRQLDEVVATKGLPMWGAPPPDPATAWKWLAAGAVPFGAMLAAVVALAVHRRSGRRRRA